MWMLAAAALDAALAGQSAVAVPPAPKPIEYQSVQTPGPRGTTRRIKAPSLAARCSCAAARYKLIQLPGPRGGTRLVKLCDADRSRLDRLDGASS